MTNLRKGFGRSSTKRKATAQRKTRETALQVSLTINGTGTFHSTLNIPFFNHMLELFAHHGQFDIAIKGTGDTQVDYHHTIEDVGICLGKALDKALGDKKGITRYGSAFIPMEETLAHCVVDICSRPYLKYAVECPKEKVGQFDTELGKEFFRALANHAGLTLHLNLLYGTNAHHILETLFKACGKALGEAVKHDPRRKSIPSTKGIL
jgi:imidazoleglycerol-phosphate dehydratase